jgi:hypothetical protein
LGDSFRFRHALERQGTNQTALPVTSRDVG